MSESQQYDVAIVGAGPVGLACAIEAGRQNLSHIVVEKGSLVNSLIGYPTNMEFFSTPELLEIGGYPLVSSRYKPLREETIDYYHRVARTENLNIHLSEKVLRLEGKRGQFTLHTDKKSIQTRNVIVSTGFFDQPNLLNVEGENLDHVHHYFKEAYAYSGRDVVVVGAKNSAAKAALLLNRQGANVTMLIRGAEVAPTVKYWIRPDLINRIDEGSIAAFYHTKITGITASTVHFTDKTGEHSLPSEAVFALIGYHPDYSFLRELGIDIDNDAVDTPHHDPKTFESNRKGVYLAGTVCGGRHTSKWFIENGRFHAEVIATQIANVLSA